MPDGVRPADLSPRLPVAVRDARPDELRPLAALLAAAFDQDPGFTWLIPRAADRRRYAVWVFASLLRRSFSHGLVLTTEDVDGVATWLPPGSAGPGLFAKLADLARLAWLVGTRVGEVTGALARVAASHPDEPHWYLDYLGTHPTRRGRGIGGALLTPILDRCDRDRVPAWLATGNEANLPFYGRHGFRVVGDFLLPRGPTTWFLLRSPR